VGALDSLSVFCLRSVLRYREPPQDIQDLVESVRFIRKCWLCRRITGVLSKPELQSSSAHWLNLKAGFLMEGPPYLRDREIHDLAFAWHLACSGFGRGRALVPWLRGLSGEKAAQVDYCRSCRGGMLNLPTTRVQTGLSTSKPQTAYRFAVGRTSEQKACSWRPWDLQFPNRRWDFNVVDSARKSLIPSGKGSASSTVYSVQVRPRSNLIWCRHRRICLNCTTGRSGTHGRRWHSAGLQAMRRG